MFARAALKLLLASGIAALGACQTRARVPMIPLVEGPAATIADSKRVIIVDTRPAKDRISHRGKDIRKCEHWFGDDAFSPSKLEYLNHRIAKRTPDDVEIRIRLIRFDIVEHCETGPIGTAATGGPAFTAGPDGGDTVVIRLTGEVNGVPFDVSRQFDYGTLYFTPHLPSSYPAYHSLLRARLEETIDRAMVSVWQAHEAADGGTRPSGGDRVNQR